LTSSGTIYGDQLLLIDQQGRTIRQALVGGFDLAVDDKRNVLWLGGKKIKKWDSEGTGLLENKCIWLGAGFFDFRPGGSVLVTGGEHPNVAKSTNRLLKISSEGQVLKAVGLPFEPLCLRVDHSDESVWVTGVAVQESPTRRLLDATEKRTGRLPIAKTI